MYVLKCEDILSWAFANFQSFVEFVKVYMLTLKITVKPL